MEAHVKGRRIGKFQEFHITVCLSDSRRKTSTGYYSREILLTVTGHFFDSLWANALSPVSLHLLTLASGLTQASILWHY